MDSICFESTWLILTYDPTLAPKSFDSCFRIFLAVFFYTEFFCTELCLDPFYGVVARLKRLVGVVVS